MPGIAFYVQYLISPTPNTTSWCYSALQIWKAWRQISCSSSHSGEPGFPAALPGFRAHTLSVYGGRGVAFTHLQYLQFHMQIFISNPLFRERRG